MTIAACTGAPMSAVAINTANSRLSRLIIMPYTWIVGNRPSSQRRSFEEQILGQGANEQNESGYGKRADQAHSPHHGAAMHHPLAHHVWPLSIESFSGPIAQLAIAIGRHGRDRRG